MSDKMSGLDANQVIRRYGFYLDNPDELPAGGLPVIINGGTLVPEKYDQIELTYVAAGNGVGEIETVTYFNEGNQIALLTLSYDGSNRLVSVVRS